MPRNHVIKIINIQEEFIVKERHQFWYAARFVHSLHNSHSNKPISNIKEKLGPRHYDRFPI